jgi:mannose-6-phosphate isomerase-like protein (cupin superfamily)
MPAVLHFLQGEAKLTLGDDTLEARPGTWVHMPKGLRHSIRVKTPVVMRLLPVNGPRPWKPGHGAGDLNASAGGSSAGARRSRPP